MKAERLFVILGLVLALIIIAPASWALDEDEDEHTNSTPVHPAHKSGGSASDADLASAASDPSSILTQFQNFFWTTGNSDDNNVANTYLLQPVLPLSKKNVLHPALPVVSTSGKPTLSMATLRTLQV